MPLSRKRRHQEPADSSSEAPDNPAVSDAEDEEEEDSDRDGDGDGSRVMVKKLVRLALACEYARRPIRRDDISQKVLGDQASSRRLFRPVFDAAQIVLGNSFGMQMVELPLKDKVTVSQRRAAQRAEKAPTTSKSWILTTTLPPAYRTPTILPPSRAPASATESTHTALYSFVVALVTLAGGSLPEPKLDRYLRRVNADAYTPLDRTDRFLARLCREGYLVRQRDTDGGEEVIEYLVGPRGKTEVGVDGVSGLVREVYGFGSSSNGNTDDSAAGSGETEEEFEAKLRRTLGIRGSNVQEHNNNNNEDAMHDEEQRAGGRASTRRSRPGVHEDSDFDE